MSMEIYKRVAPHIDRVRYDGGVAPDNVQDLLFLQQSNEQYKDVLKLSYCPELHGNKIRTSGINNFISKGYSANSLNQEFGPEIITNIADREFTSDTGFWTKQTGWSIENGTANANITSGKFLQRAGLLLPNTTYKFTFEIKNYSSGTIRIGDSSNVWSSGNSNNIISGYFTTSSSIDGLLYFSTATSFVGSIDNISLLKVESNDLSQSTAINQPFLDKIAPVEKLGAKNPNGGSCYLNHPTISFGATDKWSVEFVFNNYGNQNAISSLTCVASQNMIGTKYNDDRLWFKGNSGSAILTPIISIKQYIGKTIVVHYSITGGNIYIYINGLYANTLTGITDFNFNSLFSTLNTYAFGTTIYSYHIFSKALTAEEITSRVNILKNIFPEIPSTNIGGQTWAVRNFDAVSTPMGNNISEVQSSVNIEKITDTGFETSIAEWTPHTDGILTKELGTRTGGSGSYVLRITSSNSLSGARKNILTFGKCYKITGWARSNGVGIPRVWVGGAASPYWVGTTSTSWQYFSFYRIANDSYFYLTNGVDASSYVEFDDVSLQEIGWADSQNTYDWTYANTSGTTEQKTYAAVKAAAMWCHYNNDVANGAIYGKLYNWFAVKLLQMDIDYYNTANPTAPWGWRIPTSTDFTSMSSYLGGDSVSGGKLKMIGTNYWTTPNTGADNSSGFSALSSGFRYEDGVFQSGYTSFATTNVASSTQFTLRQLIYNTATFNQSYQFNVRGVSLRLIKA